MQVLDFRQGDVLERLWQILVVEACMWGEQGDPREQPLGGVACRYIACELQKIHLHPPYMPTDCLHILKAKKPLCSKAA